MKKKARADRKFYKYDSSSVPEWMRKDPINPGKTYQEYLRWEYGKTRSRVIEHYLKANSGLYI
jgi:hypothetical protein